MRLPCTIVAAVLLAMTGATTSLATTASPAVTVAAHRTDQTGFLMDEQGTVASLVPNAQLYAGEGFWQEATGAWRLDYNPVNGLLCLKSNLAWCAAARSGVVKLEPAALKSNEEWQQKLQSTGGFRLKSYNGFYLCASGGLGTSDIATSTLGNCPHGANYDTWFFNGVAAGTPPRPITTTALVHPGIGATGPFTVQTLNGNQNCIYFSPDTAGTTAVQAGGPFPFTCRRLYFSREGITSNGNPFGEWLTAGGDALVTSPGCTTVQLGAEHDNGSVWMDWITGTGRRYEVNRRCDNQFYSPPGNCLAVLSADNVVKDPWNIARRGAAGWFQNIHVIGAARRLASAAHRANCWA